MKERILTGLKPTGDVHVGNYFGAIEQIIDLQKEGDVFLFVADLHALTGLSDRVGAHDRARQESLSDSFIRSFIALGADPDRVTLYRQSDFPQTTELAWLFACTVKMGFLATAHAYKDAKQKGAEPSVATYLYPALMAADILLPDATVVPVGKDQAQHLELAREFARKFNRLAGEEYFIEPREKVRNQTMTVPGVDGEKMSKSKSNTVPIFGPEDEIRRRIRGIITDSTPAGEPIDPAACVVCAYLRLILPSEEYEALADQCRAGKVTYKDLKDSCADRFLQYFSEARERYAEAERDDQFVERTLDRNREKVDALFTKRLSEVRELLGLSSRG